MKEIRLDSSERIAAGWAGAGDARAVPTRAHQAPPTPAAAESDGVKRGLARTGLRFLCNAAIGLALLTAVPFVMVGRTTADWTSYDRTSIRERLTDVERFRPLVAPTDPAITPMEAGIALRALQAGKPTLEFPVREAPALARPWTDHPVTGAMFAIRTPGSTLPRIDWVVLSAKGFSPDELAYLRVLAEAPIWKEFDRVGSARSVDVIGGQYVLPFGDDAFALNMPIPRFSDTKQLAMAGVSRAAYYLAIGQPDRAEAALRSIVSFGFALIDNGTGAMDAEIGRVIVHIGRTGMEHFYMATGAIIPAGTDIDYRPSSFKYSAPRVKSPVDAAVLRQRLIADVDNAALPRALRLQRLQQLTFPSCGSMS